MKKVELLKETNRRIFYAIYGEFDNVLNPLNLKPLSSISDEDAKLVCKHHRVISSDEKWSVNSGIKLDGYSTDYLRSKGYALPWMGLSVEEMVEAGWIKLTES